MDELTVREYDIGDKWVIESVGEINVLNIQPFRNAVAKLSGIGKDAVVDLRKVFYIDSAAIEQLVVARNHLVRQGRKLIVLVEPGKQPHHVLEAIALHAFAVLVTSPVEAGLEAH